MALCYCARGHGLDTRPRPIPADAHETEEDFSFVGVIHAADMAHYQQQDADLKQLIEHLRGESTTVPRLFLRALPTYLLRDNVLYKGSYGCNEKFLLVVPFALQGDILQACHGEPSDLRRTFALSQGFMQSTTGQTCFGQCDSM